MSVPWTSLVFAVTVVFSQNYISVVHLYCAKDTELGNTHVYNELWADFHSISESGVLRRTKNNYNLTMVSSPILP
jgi:hypothetical protein